MENEIEITRKAHVDVQELKKSLKGMTDEVEISKIAEEKAQEKLDEATAGCENAFQRKILSISA